VLAGPGRGGFRRRLRPAGKRRPAHRSSAHNLYEAVAVRVPPEALSFGIDQLACRAVAALTRGRDEWPRVVARALLGLPLS